jgi:hypothetical protein
MDDFMMLLMACTRCNFCSLIWPRWATCTAGVAMPTKMMLTSVYTPGIHAATANIRYV